MHYIGLLRLARDQREIARAVRDSPELRQENQNLFGESLLIDGAELTSGLEAIIYRTLLLEERNASIRLQSGRHARTSKR